MRNKQFLAYIYNREGYHTPAITIEATTEQVAGFIAATAESPRIIITDTGDNLVLNTMYGYVDKCVDKTFLEKLLPVLMPLQMGDTEIPVLTLGWGRWQDHSTEPDIKGFKEIIKNRFDVSL